MAKLIEVTRLPSLNPDPPAKGAVHPHWVGNPPTSFVNPWPSFEKSDYGPRSLLQIRFGRARNFVPVPKDRAELVQVRKPDWGRAAAHWQDKLKATWLGHAGFLVELPVAAKRGDDTPESPPRGIRILIDAVFSERMSPFSFAGPKRFTDLPCTIDTLPDIDVLVFSHNHYDHMDVGTIRALVRRQRARSGGTTDNELHVLCTLNNKQWFLDAGLGIRKDQVTECDWWDSFNLKVKGLGSARLTCLPSQHNSGRGIFDHGSTLWGSWALEAISDSADEQQRTTKKLYFAGDTAYKSASAPSPCPAFAQIGHLLGPFDLALLPIGCYSPRHWMSNFHASPEDSLQIHSLVRSVKSVGMHYGMIRGGLSAHYEDVREPPRLWREAAQRAGKWATGECALCDVGETVCV